MLALNDRVKKFFSGCVEKIPRWERYKIFFHMTVFRYLTLWFSLVPTIAVLFSDLPNPLPLKIQGVTVNINLELPFSWQLLWLSSFSFVVAFAIYILRCPSFIKQYNKFSDYLSYAHDKRWLAWEAKGLVLESSQLGKFVERLSRKNYLIEVSPGGDINKSIQPIVDVVQTKLFFEFEGKKYCLAMPVSGTQAEADEAERGIFWEIFGRYSSSRAFARFFILVLIAISASLFVFVLVQHVCAGIELFLSWVSGFSGQ